MARVDTTTIQKTECIGNSLITINSNFNNLKNAVNNLETGIAIQDETLELGTNVSTLNLIGAGVNTVVQNGIATINIPGNEPVKVSKLEEQGINSGGGRNNFFILNDGSLRGCGFNAWGSLGTGLGDVRVYVPKIPAFDPPLQVDESISKLQSQGDCTYVITTKGRVYGTGYNAQGQLGQGNTVTSYSVFRFINVLGETTTPINPYTNPVRGYAAAVTDPVTHLATGTGFQFTFTTIFALTRSGDLYVWGYNNRSQAGISQRQTGNTITAPRLVSNFAATGRLIASGGNQNATTTFAVDIDDKLYVVGRNADGQAGINDNTGAEINISSFTLVQGLPLGYRINNVRVGGTFDNITTFAILKDGSLWAAGRNTNGAVTGNAETSPANQIAFTRVSRFSDTEFVEDVVAHMDANSVTCWALIRDGSHYRLKCWGNDSFGQMGLGTTATTRGVTSSDNWPWVLRGAKVKQIAVAGAGNAKTTLVLDTADQLWAAGYGGTGLIGNGTLNNINNTFQRVLFNPALGYPVEIRSTNNDFGRGYIANFLVLLNTGKVLGWGYDDTNAGQLGVDPFPEITTIPSLVQIKL
jgi:alpha-tubulin suppressor-like RCC1 family protein